MRYFAKIEGSEEQLPVDIEPAGEGTFQVTMREQTHVVDARVLGTGLLSLLIEGRSYGAEFEDAGDEVAVLLRGRVVRVDVADERRLRLRALSTEFAVTGKQVITAPMPGKVVKVLVKVGDEVESGQGLVVVEAMKMENELKAPKAGKVTELFAQEGSAVENNAKLVVVE